MKVVIWGINGHMGQWVRSAVEQDASLTLLGGVDAQSDGKLVVDDYRKLPPDADVVIDFSRAAALGDILAYARSARCAVVLATTGYTDEQLLAIDEAAKEIPILRSGNFSVGVNLMTAIVEQVARALGPDYDVEIVEAHHRRKVDSPSGTAKMLAAAVTQGREDIDEIRYGRHADNDPRKRTEIGLHSVRGGTIVGEHTVIFAGPDETLEIKHTALSRAIFANGAVHAAKALAGKKPALYSMKDVL